MNMDHFTEEVVVKKNHMLNDILYIFSWLIIGGSGFICLLGISSLTAMLQNGVDWVSIIFTVICGAIAVYTFLTHDKLRTEYEYTFTNGALDFAEVYNNKKRKSLGSLNVRNVDAFGKVTSSSFQRYLNTPNVKRMNWFLNRDAELYYFFFSKDSNKKMIILEPSDELVGMIRQYLLHGVYQE